VVDPFPIEQLLVLAADWSGGVLQRVDGALPMAHPGGIDVVYDTVGTGETAAIGARLLKQRGTMVKSGVHAPERWEWSPLYFKELNWVGSNAFGVEEVDWIRLHGIAHYLRLADEGRIDLTGLLTHTFRLEQWREAFCALATQETSGAIKVAFDFR
jgi:threonine dehydrogenase-like Zn-dependent dehydrogenase